MKNKKNITIEDVEKHYKPFVWDSCSEITNLSDETIGYYAYKLQEFLLKIDKYFIIETLNNEDVLINRQLKKIVSSMENMEIKYEAIEFKSKIKKPVFLHKFELFFRVEALGFSLPVYLRNGYLLKCLKDAEIKTFEELENYKAIFIYNNAKTNPHICSFVKFKKNN